MAKPDYDTTLARMAGNIAGALVGVGRQHDCEWIAGTAVHLARLIVQELRDSQAIGEPASVSAVASSAEVPEALGRASS